MPDRGIQIVIALLEKRESYLITKDSNPQLVEEILRAERQGYVQKEERSAKYTLSEKGCRWVYSGFAHEDIPQPVAVVNPRGELCPPSDDKKSGGNAGTREPSKKIKDTVPEDRLQPVMILDKADLRPAYASSFLITSLFLLTVWVIWVLGLV